MKTMIIALIIGLVVGGATGYYFGLNKGRAQKQIEQEVLQGIDNFKDMRDVFVPGEVHGVPEELPYPTTEATPREE